MDASAIKVAQAGTVESMDCRVTIAESDCPMIIEISGISAARFKAAMQAKVADVLESLGASQDACLKVDVQDNGAIDVVLGARVEAAYLRFIGVYES